MYFHIFNPCHDLALADAMPWYKPPKMAQRFASDCALLPLWYATEGDFVYAENADKEWLAAIREHFPQLNAVNVVNDFSACTPENFMPWGIDAAIAHRALNHTLTTHHTITTNQTQATNQALTTHSALTTHHTTAINQAQATNQALISYYNQIRNYSERCNTVLLSKYLRDRVGYEMVASPVVLESMEQVRQFVNETTKWVLKVPISGSGSGVIFGAGSPTENSWGRIKNCIQKFGYIMGEQQLERIMDFAIEFTKDESRVEFAGFSAFTSSVSGNYQSNILAPDSHISSMIERYIEPQSLKDTIYAVKQFLQTQFTEYKGIIGVDMFVYKHQNELRLNPVVEINLRNTMGLVARRFYDKFMQPGIQGTFYIKLFTSATDVAAFRKTADANPPLTENGRLYSGILPLTPLTQDTKYLAVAQVTS